MIFYIALDENGNRQLRGTQADARAVNKSFEQVDIPTDKAGLMAYVQNLFTEIDAVEGTLSATVPTPEPEAQPEPVPTPLPTPANDDPSEMNAGQLAPLVESTVTRLGELGEEGFEALDAYQDAQGVGGAFSRGVHILNAIAAGEHQLTRILFRARKARKWG